MQPVNIEVNIPQFLQHLVDGKTMIRVTGNNVGACLNELTRRFPQLREKLFTQRDTLHTYLEVFINGKTSYPQELDKPVKDGDSLNIINIIDGG